MLDKCQCIIIDKDQKIYRKSPELSDSHQSFHRNLSKWRYSIFCFYQLRLPFKKSTVVNIFYIPTLLMHYYQQILAYSICLESLNQFRIVPTHQGILQCSQIDRSNSKWNTYLFWQHILRYTYGPFSVLNLVQLFFNELIEILFPQVQSIYMAVQNQHQARVAIVTLGGFYILKALRTNLIY